MKGAKLAVALALALGFSSSASSSSILVMPPDLDRSQQDFVDKYFGEGGYSQLISEKELEDYYSTFSRGGKLEENVTATCKVTIEGMSGISVSSYNLSTVTDPMIETVLATAGIKDCDVTLASPVIEDGIYALASIFKGYEFLTDSKLGSENKSLAIEELIRMQAIGKKIGYTESAKLFSTFKYFLKRLKVYSDDSVLYMLQLIEDTGNYTLTEEQKQSMCRFAGKYAGSCSDTVLTKIAGTTIDAVTSKIRADHVISFAEVRIPITVEDDSGNTIAAEVVGDLAAKDDFEWDLAEPSTEVETESETEEALVIEPVQVPIEKENSIIEWLRRIFE